MANQQGVFERLHRDSKPESGRQPLPDNVRVKAEGDVGSTSGEVAWSRGTPGSMDHLVERGVCGWSQPRKCGAWY